MPQLELTSIGQFKHAKVSFGDLTVFVGNQATGKSLFLQLHKLTQDIGHIKSQLAMFGYSFEALPAFLDLYLGEGMAQAWCAESKIRVDGKAFELEHKLKTARKSSMKNFYIPAQRVLMMEYGFAKPFASFDVSYPYALKEFSELIRFELDKYFANKNDVFPQVNKLRKELRDVVSRHIYRGATIKIKTIGNKKQLVMTIDSKDFSVGSWSAGQKEFAPLLFGLYWALPPSAVSTRDKVTTITIEEPEMGLHPNATIDTMLLVLELLSRGYKVNLSTHSNTVLELFWAIAEIKQQKGKIDAEAKFLDLFELGKNAALREFAKTILQKKINIFYFKNEKDHSTLVKDISHLNVNTEDLDENEWGEISSFSTRVSNIISEMYGEIDA